MVTFKHKFKMFKNGFTLAEVLITLVIIGVVAAMTIPNLINKTNREELRTGLLKAQTVISNALEMFNVKNGYKIIPSEIRYSEGSTRVYLFRLLKPYFSIVKDCSGGVCSNGGFRTYNNKTVIIDHIIDDGGYVLNDGMVLYFESYTGNMYIAADVNGNKKPNRAGYDLFFFQLNDDGNLVPMGAEGTDYYSETDEYCSKTSTSQYNGVGCTAKALKDANYFKNLP